MPEYPSFVQFPHPGGEHSPDRGGKIGWNKTHRNNSNRVNPHRRKFMQLCGDWIDRGDNKHCGELCAWGEWEPESELISSLDPPEDGFPRYLWRPYWVPKDSYRRLHNTDPFIFGDCFAYSNCGQSAQSKQGLKDLGRGSVIAFGSGRMIGGKRKWVLDTVLVVSDSFQYDPRNPRLALEGKVSDTFLSVTGGPLADWAKNERRGPASGSCAPKSEWLRLYRGRRRTIRSVVCTASFLQNRLAMGRPSSAPSSPLMTTTSTHVTGRLRKVLDAIARPMSCAVYGTGSSR